MLLMLLMLLTHATHESDVSNWFGWLLWDQFESEGSTCNLEAVLPVPQNTTFQCDMHGVLD